MRCDMLTGMTMIQISAETVPAWLKATRGAAGLSTRAIAPSVGVTHSAVSKWERGEGEPSVTQFILWCHATHQRPEQMIEALEAYALRGMRKAPVAGESEPGPSYTPRDLNPEPTAYEADLAFWAIVSRIEVSA